jgi:hypothetical protein
LQNLLLDQFALEVLVILEYLVYPEDPVVLVYLVYPEDPVVLVYLVFPVRPVNLETL